MSKITFYIESNSACAFTEEKYVLLKSLNIPHELQHEKIHFLSCSGVYVSSNQKDEIPFVFDLLSEIPYYYLGEGCKSLSNEIKVALIEIFDSIQLDVRVSDGYSGESKWLNVQLNEDFEFEYIFDEDD